MVKRGVAGLLGVLAAIPLSGCPGGADLEDPHRFLSLQAGTAGVAGAAGMSGTAGTAGLGGSSGTAGASGGSGGGITFVPPNCDYRGVLAMSCGIPGCHQLHSSPSLKTAAGLDLKTDGIEERVFNQRPTYQDISCANPDGGVLPIICVPPGCDENALLIRPGDPTGSFLFKKIAGTHGDCGDTMPLPGAKLDATGRACLEEWITAVAHAQ